LKKINNNILYDYWQCPYKVKLLHYSGQGDNAALYTNKNLDFAKSIYAAIRDFYKNPLNCRTLQNLENYLRANWIGDNYFSVEEERAFGLEAIEILKNFYFHNDIHKLYNFMDKTLTYKIDGIEYFAKYQFGEYYAALNKFLILEYSVSPYSSKALKTKFDVFEDFNALNRIIGIFKNFNVQTVVYRRIFLRSLQINDFTITLNDFQEYYNYFVEKVKEYLQGDIERFPRKTGRHCGFCRVSAICQLSQEISYSENQQFFKFLRFITDLLQTEFNYYAFENCIKEKLKLVLPFKIDYKIFDTQQLTENFGQQFTDYLVMNADDFQLKYFDCEGNYWYYAFIGEYDNLKHFLIFVLNIPLNPEYSMHIDLLLSYIKVKSHQIQLYELSVKDKLTNLYNHGYYRYISEEELKRAKRYNKKLGFLLFDIDFFKKFNDTYGHQAGDFVLINVASIFKKSMRTQDICVRYGGEEFLAICPDINAQELFNLAENLRITIENQTFYYEDKVLNVTISGGITLFPDEGNDVLSLVRIADNKLYESKKNGRNRITI